MSLKAVEMQIALPRTHDAGKIQEQIQQRSQLSQDYAAQSVQKEDTKKRETVVKQEQKNKASLQNDSQNHHEHQYGQQNHKKKEKETQQEQHPYKGRNIDFSG